jgi:hypothetical protein
MVEVDHGLLMLADISGYTRYVGELDGNRVLAQALAQRLESEAAWSFAPRRRISSTSRTGKVTRMVTYYDRELALADAGLATDSGG